MTNSQHQQSKIFPAHFYDKNALADAFCDHFSVKIADVFYAHLITILEQKVNSGQAESCALDDLKLKRLMSLCTWRFELRNELNKLLEFSE